MVKNRILAACSELDLRSTPIDCKPWVVSSNLARPSLSDETFSRGPVSI